MATTKHAKAARSNMQMAQSARSQRTIPHPSPSTKATPGKQGAAVASRKRTGSSSPQTRAELYELAKKRELAGRSRMGRDELARKLGVS